MDEEIAKISQANPLDFYPASWGSFDRFARFYGPTHNLDYQAQKRVKAIASHLTRAFSLIRFAKRMAPTMAEDEAELQQHSYTQASRAQEVAAVVDATFCELYSTLDCLRHVLLGIYPDAASKRVKDSTRRTFLKAYEGEFDAKLPQTIANAIKNTKPWYGELLKLRDEITHAELGTCHREKETGTVTYMHPGIWRTQPDGSRICLIINDVFVVLSNFGKLINEFLGVVFQELNTTLKDIRTDQRCGIFKMRYYERSVSPSEATDFHGGVCLSHKWFDEDPGHRCPYADLCGAYKRAKQESAQSG